MIKFLADFLFDKEYSLTAVIFVLIVLSLGLPFYFKIPLLILVFMVGDILAYIKQSYFMEL